MIKHTQKILLKRNLTHFPYCEDSTNKLSVSELGTIINNFSYFGYVPNMVLFNKIMSSNKTKTLEWYNNTIEILREITAENNKIGDHVVYKNFPKEVLDMTEAEYWLRQLFIYHGVDSSVVSLPIENREPIKAIELDLKVIQVANENTLTDISKSLVQSKTAWSTDQKEDAISLNLLNDFSFYDFAFKDNGIFILAHHFDEHKPNYIKDGTDVLRLALAVSALDNKKKGLFKAFKRSERRYFLELLEKTKNLEEDILLNRKQWKKFLHLLHPHEYKTVRVQQAFDQLCKNKLQGFHSTLERAIDERNEEAVFQLIKQRVGLFANKLHHLYNIFGINTFSEFGKVVDQIDTKKLLKIYHYFKTVNNKKRGVIFSNNGKKIILQNIDLKLRDFSINKTPEFKSSDDITFKIINTAKLKIKRDDLSLINTILESELEKRALALTDNQRMDVDEKLKDVKLKNNQNENINFGYGTSIDIPENINFIRTASYWKKDDNNHEFLDNSLNFFGEKFQYKDVCCWVRVKNSYSVFSGDQVIGENRKEAAQLIDIDIQKALDKNVRYAVLSILSYNNLLISEFDEAKCLVQFCEEAQKGELFEPSRATVNFDLSKSNYKNNVCVIFDFVERKMIYINLSLPLKLKSAIENTESLKAFLKFEYDNIAHTPSLYDLLKHIHDPSADSKALYSDKGVDLKPDVKHYVFQNHNDNNQSDNYTLEHFY